MKRLWWRVVEINAGVLRTEVPERQTLNVSIAAKSRTATVQGIYDFCWETGDAGTSEI